MSEFFTDQVLLQSCYVLRILLAGIIGATIGIERKNRNKMAGIRTHAIVCLGAALIMVVSKYGFTDIASYDASRVAAQIVSGVGFLGAGIIFVKNSSSVSGLTTAAGIWATAGIGMSMGAGQYFVSVLSAGIMIGMQLCFHKINFLSKEVTFANVKIVFEDHLDIVKEIQEYARLEKIEMKGIKINKEKTNTKLELELVFPAGYDRVEFITTLAKKENIISVKN